MHHEHLDVNKSGEDKKPPQTSHLPRVIARPLELYYLVLLSPLLISNLILVFRPNSLDQMSLNTSL